MSRHPAGNSPGHEKTCSRRDFVARASSCAAHLGLLALGAPALARHAFAATPGARLAAREPWGRLEAISDGIWALISTPLSGDRTTLCNGGIVAGRSGVLVVEAFASDAGARWMGEQARALTGRAPTHIVATHYHADHTGGLRAAVTGADVTLLATAATRDLVLARNQTPATELLSTARMLDPTGPTRIDLGNRAVIIEPHDGHTASDLSIRVEDPTIAFAGDLFWNRMFPNFVDATPSRLTSSARRLRGFGAGVYVPGHGALATADDLGRYLTLLDDVEEAARRAIAAGITAEQAGSEFRIPTGLGEWTLFSARYYERAIGAWMRELAPVPR